MYTLEKLVSVNATEAQHISSLQRRNIVFNQDHRAFLASFNLQAIERPEAFLRWVLRRFYGWATARGELPSELAHEAVVALWLAMVYPEVYPEGSLPAEQRSMSYYVRSVRYNIQRYLREAHPNWTLRELSASALARENDEGEEVQTGEDILSSGRLFLGNPFGHREDSGSTDEVIEEIGGVVEEQLSSQKWGRKTVAERMKQALPYFAIGYNHIEIAYLIGVSEESFRRHLNDLCEKLKESKRFMALYGDLVSGERRRRLTPTFFHDNERERAQRLFDFLFPGGDLKHITALAEETFPSKPFSNGDTKSALPFLDDVVESIHQILVVQLENSTYKEVAGLHNISDSTIRAKVRGLEITYRCRVCGSAFSGPRAALRRAGCLLSHKPRKYERVITDWDKFRKQAKTHTTKELCDIYGISEWAMHWLIKNFGPSEYTCTECVITYTGPKARTRFVGHKTYHQRYPQWSGAVRELLSRLEFSSVEEVAELYHTDRKTIHKRIQRAKAQGLTITCKCNICRVSFSGNRAFVERANHMRFHRNGNAERPEEFLKQAATSSYVELAALYGTSESTVYRRMKRFGGVQKPWEAPRRAAHPLPDAQDFRKKATTLTIEQLAEYYETSPGTVSRWKKHFGVVGVRKSGPEGLFKMSTDIEEFQTRAQSSTVAELVQFYNVHRSTIERWLRMAGTKAIREKAGRKRRKEIAT